MLCMHTYVMRLWSVEMHAQAGRQAQTPDLIGGKNEVLRAKLSVDLVTD